MRRALVGLLVISLLSGPGCALPFRGTTTEVTIGCNVPNARIRIDNVPAQLGVVELKRGDDHVVVAEAPGYRYARATIRSKVVYGFLIPEAIFAFISVWFSLPLLIDAISGALYDLEPESVQITMEKDEEPPLGTQPPVPQNGRPAVEPSVESPASAPNAPPPVPEGAPVAPRPAEETCPVCGAARSPKDDRCSTCGDRRR